MLEQLRARRRRRQARMLAFSILGTAGLLLLLGIILSLRSCMGPARSPKIVVTELPEDATPVASEQAGTIQLSPAPLYTALDTDYLVAAMAAPGSADGGGALDVEKLVAYRLEDGKAAWERPVNEYIGGLLLSGGHAVVWHQADTGFSARGFGLADGQPAWNIEIPDAQNISVASNGKVLALGYMLADGFRIAFYNAKNGVKSGGRMISKADNVFIDLTSLNMRFVGERLLYTVDRSVGMLDLAKDRAWSANGSAAVLLASPDPANGQLYVLSRGNGERSLVLHLRAFSDGAEKELDRFETSADGLVMTADDGYLLLAYSDQLADGNYETTVRCFRKDSRDPYVKQTLSGLRVEDAMPLSGGLFVLGLNRSTGKAANPLSGGELQLVNPADGSITQLSTMRANLSYTLHFADDRLVLADDGEIQRVELGRRATSRVRRADYGMLTPLFSADYGVLGIMSSPPDSRPGARGSRLQVLIFR